MAAREGTKAPGIVSLRTRLTLIFIRGSGRAGAIVAARSPDKFMVAADATVRVAHSHQTASRHRILDANALASHDSRLYETGEHVSCAAPRPLPRRLTGRLRAPSETLFRDGGA
eukprot:5178807-Prymnesium_polylepis.1